MLEPFEGQQYLNLETFRSLPDKLRVSLSFRATARNLLPVRKISPRCAARNDKNKI